MIEGDIKAFFDTIDHHILAKLLAQHLSEDRAIHLYWNFVKAGYIQFKGKTKEEHHPDEGVPQGGILSPLLSNLYLHELDLKMEEIIRKYDEESHGEEERIANKKYSNISKKMCTINKTNKKRKAEGLFPTTEDRRLILSLRKKRFKLPSILPNGAVTRIKYVRYADDWVVGV